MFRVNMRVMTWVALVVGALVVAGCDDERAGSGSNNSGSNNSAANNSASNNSAVNNNPANNNPTNNNPANNSTANNSPVNNNPAGCAVGARRCLDAVDIVECDASGEEVVVESCEAGQICGSGRCVNRDSCTPGEVAGCWSESEQRVCMEGGQGFGALAWEGGLNCLDGECTDRICRPQEQRCLDADTVAVCNAAGDGFEGATPCADGSVCFEGRCLSGCDLSDKFPSYIGCQYWSLDLDNYPDPFGDPSAVPHAVVVSNPSAEDALVSVTSTAGVPLAADTFMVPSGGVAVYTFPRHDIDGTGISNRSFFLESTWPVVAYQFNPLNNVGVASNDASLLLPAEALGTEYIAMSWPSGVKPPAIFGDLPAQHGYVTIVATRPGDTEIFVTPSADVSGGSNVPFLPAGQPQQFTLRRGEVLNLQAAEATLAAQHDLTGTIIRADKPIAVFGGHEEAVIVANRDPVQPGEEEPDSCCAEHLEQQLFPVNTWGTRYLAVQSEPRGGSEDVWRILAAEDGTLVETVPPQPGADNVMIDRGEFVEVRSGASFEVISDKPVSVGQFLESQGATGSATGDPAFILAVPLGQLRADYTFLTPEDYSRNWITVVRPVGVAVELDGQVLASAPFSAFGSGEYEFAYVQVAEGPHTIESAEPFGLVIYGYSGAVSYGLPGGLDLRVR